MKLGRTAWLVLVIGVFAIALIALLVAYVAKSGEEKQKAADLATNSTQLTQLISGREALESQIAEKQDALDEAQSQFLRTRAKLPQLSWNIEYDEVLAEIAHDCNLDLMSLSAEEPHEEEYGGVTFMVISFTVEVRGAVGDMLDMIHAIAMDERLITACVQLVDIQTRIDEGEEPLGTIDFTGYSYPRE